MAPFPLISLPVAMKKSMPPRFGFNAATTVAMTSATTTTIIAANAAIISASASAARRRREEAINKDYGEGVTGYNVLKEATYEKDRLLGQQNKEEQQQYERQSSIYQEKRNAIQNMPLLKGFIAWMKLVGQKPKLKLSQDCWIPTQDVCQRFDSSCSQYVLNAIKELTATGVMGVSDKTGALCIRYPISGFQSPDKAP